MSKPILTYFNGRGRAEAARWIFAAADVEYEDKRITDGWQELKPNTPTGQLPMLTIDGVDIGQSGAICHLLAAKHGLNGCNVMEAAQIHMIWDCVDSLINARINFMSNKDPEQKAELEKAFKETETPRFFNTIKRKLGGGPWLVGNKMTMADIAVACAMNKILLTGGAEMLKAEPEISQLMERVTNNAGIKKWIETRPDSNF